MNGNIVSVPLKAFGNWRAKFKAEPQPPERKLLYRRRGPSPLFSPPLSPTLSHLLSPMAYPSSSQVEPIIPRPREGHRRRFAPLDALRRWTQKLAAISPTFVTVQRDG
jgi:hypothetical protein